MNPRPLTLLQRRTQASMGPGAPQPTSRAGGAGTLEVAAHERRVGVLGPPAALVSPGAPMKEVVDE